jgi:hypothetical protein
LVESKKTVLMSLIAPSQTICMNPVAFEHVDKDTSVSASIPSKLSVYAYKSPDDTSLWSVFPTFWNGENLSFYVSRRV